MTEKESLERAAAAWCGKNTSGKVMDPDLAEEFASILRQEVTKAKSQIRIQAIKVVKGFDFAERDEAVQQIINLGLQG